MADNVIEQSLSVPEGTRLVQQNINVPEGSNMFTGLRIPKYLTDMEYVRIFTDSLMAIATDGDLCGQDIRVLMGCIGNMEFENRLNKSQSELAEFLGMKQQNVSKHLKKLVDKDYLRIIGKIGRQNIYRINPHIAFKSRAKNFEQLSRNWEADREAS